MGKPTTCIKFINLHKKSRQNLRKQICHKALFASMLSDPIKGTIKYVSHYESETLYWQFFWYLVPSKLTTHRHCRLLWTRSWSHKQSKSRCCQLSKKYKINWISFVDKKLLPVNETREPFSETNCLKINIWLFHPWSKCGSPTQG